MFINLREPYTYIVTATTTGDTGLHPHRTMLIATTASTTTATENVCVQCNAQTRECTLVVVSSIYR
jgi:hypothetical protein